FSASAVGQLVRGRKRKTNAIASRRPGFVQGGIRAFQYCLEGLMGLSYCKPDADGNHKHRAGIARKRVVFHRCTKFFCNDSGRRFLSTRTQKNKLLTTPASDVISAPHTV